MAFMLWNILLLCESDGNKLSEGHPTLIAALIVAGIYMLLPLLLLLLFMSLFCVRILTVFAKRVYVDMAVSVIIF